MKILLIGKSGQLGAEILNCITSHEIYAPDRTMLDIRSRDAVNAALDRYRP